MRENRTGIQKSGLPVQPHSGLGSDRPLPRVQPGLHPAAPGAIHISSTFGLDGDMIEVHVFTPLFICLAVFQGPAVIPYPGLPCWENRISS